VTGPPPDLGTAHALQSAAASRRVEPTRKTTANRQSSDRQRPADPGRNPGEEVETRETGETGQDEGFAPARPAKAAARAKPLRTDKPSRPVAPLSATAKPPSGKPAAVRSGSRQGLRPVIDTTGPSSHEQAVESFERGFQALQQRHEQAAELLGAVVNSFTDEKELQERARVILRSASARLRRDEATVVRRPPARAAIGDRRIEAHSRRRWSSSVSSEIDDPANDYVQHMLSVVHTAVGNAEQAVAHLRKAIELAPENQFRAIQDPDLEPLRQDAAFVALAGAPFRRRRTAAKKR
jgi:hypothetical protein